MRIALVFLLLLSAVNLAAALDLCSRVRALEAPPPKPTHWIPGTLPPELVEDPPIVFPVPHGWTRGPR